MPRGLLGNNDEPRPLPVASDAERSLTLGAIFAILAGVVVAARWVGAGASSETFAADSFFPMGAFAFGVAVRALGAFLTRFSDRTGLIVVGDAAAFLIFALIATVTGAIHDPSGSVGLAAAIGIGFGLPLVSLLSFASASLSQFRPARRALFSVAFLFALIGIAGYGATYWR